MARSWYDKVLKLLGYSDQAEEYDSFEDAEYIEPKVRTRTPVISLHSSPEVKIVVLTPVSFDEVEKIANQLKSRKTVVVNFSKTTKELSQRILDFLGGTVFALNGSMQRVSSDTFMFAPSNISIQAELPEGLSQEKFLQKLREEGIKDR
ncbi:MAG TPA: cell division protein SepF [Syntrophaceticus sp.]|nr:cell division protein SepF [Syntrophaceticus sp.]